MQASDTPLARLDDNLFDPSCAGDSLSQNKSDQLCCGRNQPGIGAAMAMNDYPKRVRDNIIPLSVGDTLPMDTTVLMRGLHTLAANFKETSDQPTSAGGFY